MNRRKFIVGSAAVGAGLGLRIGALAQQKSETQASLKIDVTKTGVTVPHDFTGLSYESAQLGSPDFFSAQNTGLIEKVRGLGLRGVLRIGGNTSAYTKWSQEDLPQTGAAAYGPDASGSVGIKTTTITPAAIRNLRGFLDAVGWDLIYGLNLGTGTPEAAAEEAAFVTETIGPRLLALQFGNEPDIFHRHIRPAAYGFPEYFAEWRRFARAVRQKAPAARFAGPDVASNYEWVTRLAAEKPADLALLTGHYYAEGPPTDPRMTWERLLQPNPANLKDIASAMQAAGSAHLPFRMAEGNSCYRGGKEGVSDTFASALWCGDYMLQVAQAGYSGVNLHGGGNGLYTPIAGDKKNGFTARPEYYGMVFAERFAGGEFVEAKLETASNVTAYAAKKEGALFLAVFNKSGGEVGISMQPEVHRHPRTMLLTAPSVTSKTSVRFQQGKLDWNKSGFVLKPYTAALIDLG